MKNSMAQVSLFVIAFVALSLLMSYTRPGAEEPKEYTVVVGTGDADKFSATINEKINSRWHPLGGIATANGSGRYIQAMVK
jgi:hypothetical protein